MEYRGFEIRYLETTNSKWSRRIVFPLRAVQEIAKLRPRIVHCHSRAEIPWLMQMRRMNIPSILSCDYHLPPIHHSLFFRQVSRTLWRRCMHSASIISPVSEYCAQMQERSWGLPAEKIYVIPNGVDVRRFRPDRDARNEWRARLGLHGKQVLLYVGRLCEQKGTDLLISAFLRVKEKYPDVCLLAVGPADQFGRTEANSLVARLEIATGIYLPPVDDDELPGIYNAADLFVMPTRELEMFGMAAVEAQACGKAVVASNNGGLPETVSAGSGVLFESGNVDSLARTLELLLTDRSRRETLQFAARSSAARFDWEIIARRCEAVYQLAERRQITRGIRAKEREIACQR
jgi:spore coat protein SA